MRKKQIVFIFAGLVVLQMFTQCTGNLLKPDLAFNEALPKKYMMSRWHDPG